VPQGATEPSLFPENGNEDTVAAAQGAAASAGNAAGGGTLSERQQLILSGIGADHADVDTIVERTALPAHVVLQELTFLSLKGQLRRVDGQTYVRARSSAG
jgi:predicted Rossmann fold nucleotide-binding protein DprA/Smf involved in DNA uptake